MTTWFNPRSLVPRTDLDDIYRYESISGQGGLFPQTVLEHWASVAPTLPIPPDLHEMLLGVGRPTPLTRARRLEQRLGTGWQIYLKREDTLPNGSFKITSALPQAYFGAAEGRERVVVETGAGQTGAAAAMASRMVGLSCEIYMVRASYERKLLRRRLMEFYGATVHASPSPGTVVGRRYLEQGQVDGSIAIATSEVMELLDGDPTGMNIAGSLLDFTLAYTSLLGLELRTQLHTAGLSPDLLIGCVGGGSSFGGFALPFLDTDGVPPEIIATESTAIPTLSGGRYDFDHPDGEGEAPPLKMYSVGHRFVPSAMHATGLRYHAASPLVSYFVHHKAIQAVALDERDAVRAARLLAETEGIVIAPESSYSVAGLVEALAARERPGVAVVLVSGSGHLDLDAYASVDAP